MMKISSLFFSLFLLLIGINRHYVRCFSTNNHGGRMFRHHPTQQPRTILPLPSSKLTLPVKSKSISKSISTSISRASTTRIHAVPPTVGTAATVKSSANILKAAGLHKDPMFALSAVLLLSTFGITLERRTMIGKALSAPLATMALALIVANLGLIPFVSPVYDFVNRYLVALAVPLLLFDSDLRRVFNDTGSLLLAFIIGAISTIVGTLVAYPLIPLQSLGANEGWKVSSALAARHIGGAINFVAVAETLNIGGTAVSAAIAADNIVVALYFAFLFYLAKPGDDIDEKGHVGDSTQVDMPTDPEDIAATDDKSMSLSSLALSITTASCLVTLGKVLSKAIFPVGTSALPLISIITVFGATLLPQFFSSLSTTGTALGIYMMQMFFAASGAAGSIQLVLQSAPTLFLFSGVQIAVHFITLTTLGKFVFRLKARELYLASNANVGGPTTAAAMAQAKQWPRLVLPALLIGILGYASATPIALGIGQVLLKFPVR